MLSREARLTSSADFRRVVAQGARTGRDKLVVHAMKTTGPAARAGFVVSKAVGNAVVRNSVKRRLRHLCAPRLLASPFPVDVVVRALPPAATGDLRADFSSAWEATMRKLAA